MLLALIGSVLTHYVFGGLRLQTPGQKLTAAARVQLSVLLGLFVALKAVAYWLDRYGLVYSDRGEVFTGASYTDINALLVPKTILVFVAAVCALAFFANIFVRNFLLPAAALVLLLISSLVIGVAYPAIVQQFVVRPSADQKEAPYIERAIESTLAAYGLDDIEYVDYAQSATGDEVDTEAAQAELRNDTETIPNARLLDPNVLSQTFTARQQIRNVYGFPEKLDIDRYTLPSPTTGEDTTRDYVVAVRELNSAGLSENQDTWINRHTVYTHGNGFVAAPANEVVAGQEGGEPNFTTRDLPTVGDIERRPAAHLLRRADPAGRDRTSTPSSGRRRGRTRGSSTSPRTARTRGRSTTPTTATAGCRSAASSASSPSPSTTGSGTSCSRARSTTSRRCSTSATPATAWRRPPRSSRSTATRIRRSSTAG